jgi:hypothetical protein
MLKTEWPAARQINSILEQNGYSNGNHQAAWETINQKVVGGELSARDIFIFGLSGSQSISFPSGQIEKSLEVGQAYADIQDQLFNDPETPDPTSQEVWVKFEDLIRGGRYTAKDIYYFGALEHLLASSTTADCDGDC